MNPKLAVITPCSRPENLSQLAPSLAKAKESFDVDWYVVHDCHSGECEFPLPDFAWGHLLHRPSVGADTAGHAQANHALDRIDAGLVWRLDDDNLPVPGFFARLRELDDANPRVDLFLFGQLAARRYDEAEWPEGWVPPIPRVGKMDTAQFVFRREALGPIRFLSTDYKADGRFIEELCTEVSAFKIWKENAPLTQYNALAREMFEGPEPQAAVVDRLFPPKVAHFYESIEGFFHFPPLYKRVVAEAGPVAKFVEVGVWKGRSAAYMGVEIANSGKDITVYAVDAFTTTHDGSGPVNEERLSEVVKNLAPVSKHVSLIGGKSVPVAATFENGSCDFVFLDADHSEEGCRADILAWLPKIKPGGLLAGDDYCYPGCEGVKLAVDALLPGATVPERFEEGVSGWWEYRKPLKPETDAPGISIITPLHAYGNAFIVDTWKSLRAQTVKDWEWLIMENSGGRVPPEILKDRRVRVLSGAGLNGIGALKRRLSDSARAKYVVELDCDDLLAPTALVRVVAALQEGDFAYSDFAEFQDRTWAPGIPYRADCGWRTYPVKWQGHKLLAHKAPPATPQNMRLVDWAPNHIRAWRSEAYREVGGHNPFMIVADDHDLVVRFLLNRKRFVYIPACLYFYRLHESNTVKQANADIRRLTEENYQRYCWRLAELSGPVYVGRNTNCKDAMPPGSWLFLICPKEEWHDRSKIPLLKGDFHVAALYDRGHTVEAHLIRLGPGYEPMGQQCGDGPQRGD